MSAELVSIFDVPEGEWWGGQHRIPGKPGHWFNGFQVHNMGAATSIHDVRFLYFIEFQAQFVKVGVAWDVKERLEQFRLGCPRGLSLRGKREVPGCFARQVEKRVHVALDEWADGREWFKMRAIQARDIAQPIIDASWIGHAEAVEAGVLYPADVEREKRVRPRLARR